MKTNQIGDYSKSTFIKMNERFLESEKFYFPLFSNTFYDFKSFIMSIEVIRTIVCAHWWKIIRRYRFRCLSMKFGLGFENDFSITMALTSNTLESSIGRPIAEKLSPPTSNTCEKNHWFLRELLGAIDHFLISTFSNLILSPTVGAQ